ncbi:MAG: helix-turn-helix domain-containing protein [Phycisphaerae bacterium]
MSNFTVAAAPGGGGESPLLDQRSAAKFLRLSVKTLYNLRMAGELPYIQIGDRILLYVADLHAFIQRKRKGGN